MFENPSRTRPVVADEIWRPVLAEAAQQAIHTTVHSAFDHAVNIVVDGELLTLLASTGRPQPGAMITSQRHFVGVRAGEAVALREHAVVLGNAGSSALAVDVHGITYFTCRVEPLTASALETRDPFDDGEPPYSIDPPGAFTPNPSQLPFDRAVAVRLQHARSAFSLALAGQLSQRPTSPLNSLRRAIADLIGLGIGLTPSGDDYLVGALATLSLHPDSADARLAVAVCLSDLLLGSDGAGRTTDISRHFLIAACKRSFHHDLAAAGRALLEHDARAISETFAATAAIGSTSGSDALTGLVDAHNLLLRPIPGQLPANLKVNTHD
ncbi:DUF2877 domain-containing protein [Leucobacter viscericola]|uniref:DUF2877 domain-containing protein n=1 Tax=Leucobacter viscericola TaxID=2714935 RepID=A0A6G7XIF3_9MICO|nr:DUF2877 domain-containing protein [Leucobacter viscericola]QIK64323.1 DUF2877 domain-containing protein [Leucobacter viscericola]